MMKRLSRKLVLEARTRAGDGAGGFTTAWVPLGTHWGAVDPARGRLERGEGDARSQGAYRVTIRAVPPNSPARPNAGQRFRDGTRVFDIRAVVDASDARFLIAYVDEEVAP